MNKFRKTYIINSFEVDVHAKLRIHSLFNLLQDVADLHAEEIGVGRTFCKENNLAWVGASYHLKINRLPNWNEKISIETWPSGATAASAIRDFKITDEKGNIVIVATSQWVLLDSLRLRPVPITKHLPHYTPIEETALPFEPLKLTDIEGEVKSISFPVHYDDIDVNGHVNNALYPTWVWDTFSDEFIATHTPRDIEIVFKRPSKLGDVIELKTTLNQTESLSVIGTITTEFARVKIIWA